MASFNGYSPETVDFLWGIRMNNNREWFLEHKKEYVKYLYEPTKALGNPGSILVLLDVCYLGLSHLPLS